MQKSWIVKMVSEEIYRQHPEFSGIRPSIKTNDQNKNTFILTYQTAVQTATGKKMIRRLKVTVDPEGRIQKITSSK